MKNRYKFLSAFAIALGTCSFVHAGVRCGGCSDPCSSQPHRLHRVPMAIPYHAAPSITQACQTAHVSYDGAYHGAQASAPCDIPSAMVIAPAHANQIVAGCEPITGYRTVMESVFATEKQFVTVMENKQEIRQRAKQVTRTVQVPYQDFRIKNHTVPKTETKTVEYEILVPETSTKQVSVQVSVPVWSDVTENYTVKVPKIVEVPEVYTVRVPQLRDQSFTYTVYVPVTETQTKTQTVTNAVPVTKTRTIQRSIPKYSTQMVTKDYGHWETVVEEVNNSCFETSPCSAPAAAVPSVDPCHSHATSLSASGCSSGIFSRRPCRTVRSTSSHCNCGSCAAGTSAAVSCTTQTGIVATTLNNGCTIAPAATTTRRVWVPNLVEEPVQIATQETITEDIAFTVYEQQSTVVPYTVSYVVYRPETRTGTRKVLDYVSEEKTRTRKVANYVEETRTRTRKELSYKLETKEETYPVVNYRTEKKTKEISYTVQVPEQIVEPFQATRLETVTEDVLEDYVTTVQIPVTKEIDVQVCKLVPKLVPFTFTPCSAPATHGFMSANGQSIPSSGCGPCGSDVNVTRAAAWGVRPSWTLPTVQPNVVVGGCGCGN